MATRWTVLLALAMVPAASSADDGAKHASTVTEEIPAGARRRLVGCWQDRDERWQLRATGSAGLEVVREIRDSAYADRARLPRPLRFDPAVGNYAFAAAGRIHALLMVFVPEGDTLTGSWLTSHDGRSYAPTGSTVVMTKCRGR